jgi:hypothetical protein
MATSVPILALALTMMTRMLTMMAPVLINTDRVLDTALILILATILVLVLALPHRSLCPALATLRCQVAHILHPATLLPASVPVSRLDHTHLLTEAETCRCQFTQHRILHHLYQCRFPVWLHLIIRPPCRWSCIVTAVHLCRTPKIHILALR